MEEEEAPDEGNVSVTPFRLTADRFPIIPCKPETPRAGPKDVGGDGREGSNEVKVLMHEEVSTESIINARSTLSWDSKNSSLMQQVLRILLLNCMKVTMGSRSSQPHDARPTILGLQPEVRNGVDKVSHK